MIKCYFVDIKNISSELPRSRFSESELDRLADAILATDGLLRPLILQEVGVEKYVTIEGHREYYAAVKAKEKNPIQAEMVNAFVIAKQSHQSAVYQLELLKDRQLPPAISNEIGTEIDRQLPAETPVSIDRLLPILVAAISQQLQPIVTQLAEQKQILDLLILDRKELPQPEPTSSPVVVEPSTPPPIELSPVVVVEPVLPAPINLTTLAKSPANQRKQTSEPKIVSPTIPKEQATSTQSASISPKPEKTTKNPTSKSKKTVSFLDSIDPTKATITLSLINTLDLKQLMLSLERSGLSKTIVKLAAAIIKERDNLAEQKFDSWEVILATNIKGLKEATIRQIIDKLK